MRNNVEYGILVVYWPYYLDLESGGSVVDIMSVLDIKGGKLAYSHSRWKKGGKAVARRQVGG